MRANARPTTVPTTCTRVASRRVSRRRAASTASSSSSSSSSSSCVLLLGEDDDDLRVVERAVRRVVDATGVDVVRLTHASTEGSTRDGRALALSTREDETRGDGDGFDDDGVASASYDLREATGEDAAVVALDPTDGLLARLGRTCALAIVVARAPCLGEDVFGHRAARSARRCAVAGTPTILASVPTTSKRAPIEPCAEALETVLRRAWEVIPNAPRNNPRSHFPFPTRGRWASLGTAQLPMDDELAASVLASNANEFASADCWSLGGFGAVPHFGGGGGGGTELSPRERREALRDAFQDADVFLNLSVPPTWTAAKGFSATRPGVLWRQERCRAVDGEDSRTPASTRDRFGRTLPAQDLSTPHATEKDARFVRQLATERLIEDRAATTTAAPEAASPRPLPRAFVVADGVVVADDSPRGDVDAVMRGVASITTVPTWPAAHAFCVLDALLVESLRADDAADGVPAFLVAESDTSATQRV